MTVYHCGSQEGQFQLSEVSYIQIDNDWMCSNYVCVDWSLVSNFPCYPYQRWAFLNSENRPDSKSKWKEPSESNKLIINVIGVTRISILVFR